VPTPYNARRAAPRGCVAAEAEFEGSLDSQRLIFPLDHIRIWGDEKANWRRKPVAAQGWLPKGRVRRSWQSTNSL